MAHSRAIHTVRFKSLDAQRAGAGNAAGKLWVSGNRMFYWRWIEFMLRGGTCLVSGFADPEFGVTGVALWVEGKTVGLTVAAFD
ncbi:MAG: hypothetical protein ABGX68_02220 [Methylococcales bacterium]